LPSPLRWCPDETVARFVADGGDGAKNTGGSGDNGRHRVSVSQTHAAQTAPSWSTTMATRRTLAKMLFSSVPTMDRMSRGGCNTVGSDRASLSDGRFQVSRSARAGD